jgi:protein-S-isoprenylcysteine O-methyltransferase Ste14
MYYWLILLILGFGSNLASAYTTTYSEKWGEKTGTFITIILRDVFGIPVWAVGFVLAIKESVGVLYRSSVLSQVGGWFIMAVGAIIIIIALITIRARAAAPSTSDTLIKSGLYSLVRHPIHCGTILEFAGLFILWPSVKVGIAVLIGFLWIYFQSKLEERDLLRRIFDYKKYMEDVPRFFPDFLRRSNTEVENE